MPADPQSITPLRAAALVYDGLCTFEYGIVAEAFGLHRPELGGDLYHFTSHSVDQGPMRAAGGLQVTADGTPEDLSKADILIVPGWRGKDALVPEHILAIVRAAHARQTRLLSICSGVYVLAQAGVLDGRQATTHWRYAKDLQHKYPSIKVNADMLYTEQDGIFTSAGSSAGIDACLHVIRSDHGAQIANSVARRLVMHAHRQGGQAQFIEQPLPVDGQSHRLSNFIDEVRQTLAANHTIETMAARAGMSSRTFQRRFQALTGQPAMQWLVHERMMQCCTLLETTEIGIEQIGISVGFPNAEAMRYHFRRTYGISPGEYRKRFARMSGSLRN